MRLFHVQPLWETRWKWPHYCNSSCLHPVYKTTRKNNTNSREEGNGGRCLSAVSTKKITMTTSLMKRCVIQKTLDLFDFVAYNITRTISCPTCFWPHLVSAFGQTKPSLTETLRKKQDVKKIFFNCDQDVYWVDVTVIILNIHLTGNFLLTISQLSKIYFLNDWKLKKKQLQYF